MRTGNGTGIGPIALTGRRNGFDGCRGRIRVMMVIHPSIAVRSSRGSSHQGRGRRWTLNGRQCSSRIAFIGRRFVVVVVGSLLQGGHFD